jgi:hypothetical protein
MKLRYAVLSVVLAASSLASFSAFAERHEDHPAYLHALSDLRAARWLLEHQGGDWRRTEDEAAAVSQIDEAIRDLQKAAVDDGKNPNDRPPVGEFRDGRGRIHAAIDYLKRARDDISHEEDNRWAEGLRDRSYHHIDQAIERARHAVHE